MKSNVQTREHRRSARRNAFMPGTIYFPNQTEHVDCMVCNLSQDGALLETSLAKELPSMFSLRLKGETKLRYCTVVWRSGIHMGVEFSEQIVDRQRVERWGEPVN